MTPSIFRPLLVAACAALFTPALSAAPGDLDTTFGTGGKVDTGIGFSRYAYANAFAVQGDGKIIAAGYFDNGTYDDFALVRLNADGTFDSGFGTGGKVTTSFGDSAGVYSVAVQSDGKIVAAGRARVGGSSFAVALARYNADGTLDTGFGTGGKVTTDVGSLSDIACSIMVQSDGKIVAVGFNGVTALSFNESGNAIALRYNADGTLDSGFGSGGTATAGTTTFDAPPFGALQSDGKIVVVRTGGFTVARLNTDGTPDTGFGSGGVVTNNSGGIPTCMALQSDGKILAAGVPASQSDFAVARFNADGTIDTGFGSSGIVTTDFAGDQDLPNSIAVQGDGKIVVVGFAGVSGGSVGLVRYKADGTLDSSFGSGGKVSTDFGASSFAAKGVALQGDGRILVGVSIGFSDCSVARFLGGSVGPTNPPVPPPVYDTKGMTTDGSAFLSFGAPAVDSGVVGGAATVKANGKKQTIIYGDANGATLAQTGGQDAEGATFTELGDPIFAGEALGFAATAELAPSSIPALRRVGFGVDERVFAVRPGGRLAALYSQLSRAGGIHRLAGQADPAPGGGQFARFPSFALPRQRVGLLYAALLHRDGTVNARNDFGIWRERSDGTGTDLLLRTGQQGFPRTRGGGAGRGLKKVTFMPPVSNATDQRLSHAPDGGLGALAKFDDGSDGVVRVAADGSVDVPLDDASAVPDEAGTADGSVVFERFAPPATASGGRLALVAALQAAARGQPAPPQAVFANTSGTMQRVLTRGETVPGAGDARWGQLGQPLLGEKGMIGLIAALTGKDVKGPTNKALVRIENGTETVAVRLGDAAPGYGSGVVFRKFMSMVVTDSDPGRMVFTALVGGPGVNGSNNVGLWSIKTGAGTSLVLRSGGTIQASGQTLTVRTFETLIAPKKSQGQGRSTDASGFVTAKAKLSDGRVGVLRIPLP